MEEAETTRKRLERAPTSLSSRWGTIRPGETPRGPGGSMWMGNDTGRDTKAPATKGTPSSPSRRGASQCTSETRATARKEGAEWGPHKGIGIFKFF